VKSAIRLTAIPLDLRRDTVTTVSAMAKTASLRATRRRMTVRVPDREIPEMAVAPPATVVTTAMVAVMATTATVTTVSAMAKTASLRATRPSTMEAVLILVLQETSTKLIINF
jgi:hypothetical protein